MAEWRDEKGVLCVGLKLEPVPNEEKKPEPVPNATEVEKPKRTRQVKDD